MAATRSGSAAPRADAIPQIPHTVGTLENGREGSIEGYPRTPPRAMIELLRLSSMSSLCGY
jgi:hypothetical protein